MEKYAAWKEYHLMQKDALWTHPFSTLSGNRVDTWTQWHTTNTIQMTLNDCEIGYRYDGSKVLLSQEKSFTGLTTFDFGLSPREGMSLNGLQIESEANRCISKTNKMAADGTIPSWETMALREQTPQTCDNVSHSDRQVARSAHSASSLDKELRIFSCSACNCILVHSTAGRQLPDVFHKFHLWLLNWIFGW